MSTIGKRVVNIDELKLEHFEKGETFASEGLRVGPLLGARDLGYSYDVVPPGKRACPFHSHRGEEEMFFIVRGTGTLRYGDERATSSAARPVARTPRTRSSMIPMRSSRIYPSAR